MGFSLRLAGATRCTGSAGSPRTCAPPPPSGSPSRSSRASAPRPDQTSSGLARTCREQGRAQDRVRPPQLTVLLLQLGHPGGFAGGDPGAVATVDLGLADSVAQRLRVDPELFSYAAECSGPRGGVVAGSWQASRVIRVARSRSSSGYFHDADMACTLPVGSEPPPDPGRFTPPAGEGGLHARREP